MRNVGFLMTPLIYQQYKSDTVIGDLIPRESCHVWLCQALRAVLTGSSCSNKNKIEFFNLMKSCSQSDRAAMRENRFSGFWPVLIHIGLYSHRRGPRARLRNFGLKKKRDCTIHSGRLRQLLLHCCSASVFSSTARSA